MAQPSLPIPSVDFGRNKKHDFQLFESTRYRDFAVSLSNLSSIASLSLVLTTERRDAMTVGDLER